MRLIPPYIVIPRNKKNVKKEGVEADLEKMYEGEDLNELFKGGIGQRKSRDGGSSSSKNTDVVLCSNCRAHMKREGEEEKLTRYGRKVHEVVAIAPKVRRSTSSILILVQLL